MKLTLIISLFITTNIMAQKQKTFVYEITLYEQYKNSSSWGEKEKKIQQEHISYLDSLTTIGKIEIAGIIDQKLENQTGIIILNVDSYEQAKEIVLNDPSIKQGIMSARLRPINIYFKRE